ncbi:hypothetical protein EDD37DRAFT_187978 [Exophiala viscosa]|uniref:F-box domain-containing protein n=1 Tax=Exophiala viscosa TaxID=2486360 RepID=A0AAN6DMW9_9EURO|nr:hypothetical protein EDD36DRAFT_109053 [Exophiala viscosa]KAI1620158.1 hypothetical protein EDD37DRAFT_187978 [Exophiala viscosa]
MTLAANHLYSNGPEIQGAFGVDALPLTTVAHIISFLDDDVGSLARLCRTSKVLYYMTLPHLWKRVALKSHSTVHYRDNMPEGLGSASPFSMGLNALVTRHVSNLVRSLVLEGDFKVADLEEYARASRISESTMILNIAVRAAIDQCLHLESFKWDLNVRIQPNMYAGLAKLSRLESLWLRCPARRSPQPSSEIPPLPGLKSFTLTHYDPLCYPDDVSTFFLHAHRLETLNMHFSPRMRDECEPSVHLTRILRKNIAAKKQLHIKRLGLYNLFADAASAECEEVMDISGSHTITVLNSFGLDEDDAAAHRSATHFIDRTWMVHTAKEKHPPKSIRVDHVSKFHALHLSQAVGMERLYLINARHKPEGTTNGTISPSPGEPSPSTSSGTPTPTTILRDLYLDGICGVCGPTLKHLILPARWCLPAPLTAKLVRSCPNLTQLSASIECDDMGVLRLIFPFLSKLWAIRVLQPKLEGEDGEKRVAAFNSFISRPDCMHESKLEGALSQRGPAGGVPDFPALRYIGLGHKIWEIGGVFEEVVQTPISQGGAIGSHTPVPETSREEIVYKRRIRRIDEKDVAHVEIWNMDSTDII